MENEDKESHLTDESHSISTTSSQVCHPPSSPRLDSSEVDSKTSSPTKRYKSPMFENLLPVPIQPVKVTRVLSIPNDNSIENLLEVVSLVAKTTKPSNDDGELTKTNHDNNDQIANNEDTEIYNEWHSLGTLVAEKRPSFQDPEIVLLQNVVPGNNKST